MTRLVKLHPVYALVRVTSRLTPFAVGTRITAHENDWSMKRLIGRIAIPVPQFPDSRQDSSRKIRKNGVFAWVGDSCRQKPLFAAAKSKAT